MPESGRSILKNRIKNTSRASKPRIKRKKVKKNFSAGKYILLPLLLAGVMFVSWHYRYPIYYFITKATANDRKPSITNEMRIFDVLNAHKDRVIGFDVSQYQGVIDWKNLQNVQDSFQLDFVFIRATAGRNVTDRKFRRNWRQSKKQDFIRGAYHYYRPNENSILQADNFIKAVKLEKGDLPPVLDIESMPNIQSMDSLKKGLKRWLGRVEAHYGIKPIIYTSNSFYNDYLYEDFEEYSCWIANYNFYVETIDRDWDFWQFTEEAFINGIDEKVDLNIYKGSKTQLMKMLKK
ncbi:glycoside hydrolase family 25 protein [Ascidiimonas sp. W6]|uniref:glycoside hydrolase family 25 protein n=1 Tax=Ascidiimonas meishanensis TaxID=3128903 RepID=UPI0030ECAF3C